MHYFAGKPEQISKGISVYLCNMEIAKDLYRVLILFSAGVLLLGVILNLRLGRRLSSTMKMLLILAVVNLASMASFLFNLKSSTNSDINVALVFLDSLILIMNMIIGRYVYQLHTRPDSRFENQIKHLFLFAFLSECIFLLLIFGFRAEDRYFDTNTSGFIYIFLYIVALLLWGSILPGIRSVYRLSQKKREDARIYILLILNLLNNTIGIFFFSLQFPNKEFGLFANMIINIVFAYYYGYYMLSSYFEVRKNELKSSTKTPVHEGMSDIYKWNDLRQHLSHWSETKAYLIRYNPELIKMVDQCPLSDLEKIHYTLKLLKIKSKEIAAAMNISTRAVEMQRYRIGKKLQSAL